MSLYSVYVMDFVVVDAESEEDAADQAKEWFQELLANDEVTFDVVEGDESDGEEEDDGADDA